jgi:hypothetical protein
VNNFFSKSAGNFIDDFTVGCLNKRFRPRPNALMNNLRRRTFRFSCYAGALALSLATTARADKTWKNVAANTDWNTNGSWVPSGVPTAANNDFAIFSAAKVSNPNLSANGSALGLNFSTISSSGYDITSSSTSVKLTLTSIGTGTSSAINAANTSGTNIIDAPIVLGAAASTTQTFTQASGGTLVVNGAVTSTNNPVTLNITGGGTVLVNGTVASTIPVTVNGTGTTLGGTGTINNAVTLGNTTPGVILNAGPSGTNGTSASVGTLHTGALTLTGANTFHVDAFGTATNQWDQVAVNGLAALGTTSQLQLSIATAGLNFAAGTTYVLIDATTISGSFANATEGSVVTVNGYNFTAHYDTALGNFDLIAIPEPSTWVAAALTLLTIGFMQRRKMTAALARLSTKV